VIERYNHNNTNVSGTIENVSLRRNPRKEKPVETDVDITKITTENVFKSHTDIIKI
jgi:hypothetical protein